MYSLIELKRLNRICSDRFLMGIALALLSGLMLRGLAQGSRVQAWVDSQLQWLNPVPVILYYLQKNPIDNAYTGKAGYQLVPVSTFLAGGADDPATLFRQLSSDLPRGGELLSPIPAETRLLNVSLDTDGVLELFLSKNFLQTDSLKTDLSLVVPALSHTMKSLPDIRDVVIHVARNRIGSTLADSRMLYFYSSTQGHLIAIPLIIDDPHSALMAYLDGPKAGGLVGLPADVEILDYRFDAVRHNVELNFSYTSSLRELALNYPQSMRSILLGLIATMTQFPEIKTVTLAFDGHARLGVGQCASLIGTQQTYPTILNDRRLF